MDIFSTFVLNRVVESLHRPASFLLDAFFPSVQTEDSEEIHFDIDQSKPRLAPFVSPLVEGKVVAEEGYQTYSFKPAYVKDKRRFNPNAPLKRAIGETIGGSLTPMNRREAALNKSMTNQLENLTRREEVMASEAMRFGRVTVSGENYPTTVVDFKRHADLTRVLLGNLQWGEPGVNPLNDLEDWASIIQLVSGAAARTVVFDPLAWRLFKDNDKVDKLLDKRRGTDTTLSIDPIAFGEGNKKVRYVGSIGDFEFFVYNDVYVDDDGVDQSVLPSYTVLMGSAGELEGTRCYGVIQDEKANYQANRYFSKSWLEEDPAVRWLLMQSAPLIVPYRPNASMCITVRQRG
ncbi:major capsid protein [Teredinibacter sp. KSP-S5-2]|uniref:major capsid protein n=1 Tax=Teredinibacter sp. KSP-S5-2 TaxID=3034506 RepID=UPI002934824E|nr:major capsid protein [Teredinibacter sp. KSP-S5-2]WNO10430.1 major capsid protein [Teredinibacter sp. KSP-S5-2]